MRVVPCRACNELVAYNAKECPKCGCKKPRSRIRETVTVMLIFFALWVMFGSTK